MSTASPTLSAPAGVAIRMETVHRVFDNGVVAVEDVTLDIHAGEFVALLGPSGCGKSTLLRIVAGLDQPTSGSLRIGPTPIKADASPDTARISFVFQDAQLLPWRTVLKNVALPLELQGVSKSERLDRAHAVIKQVGLAEAVHRYPAQLSGGMRMRASLARALINQPELLLLDEPFAALDELTRQKLDEHLRELWHTRQMTTLFVTHSITEAAFLSTRAVVFTTRPARVVLDQPIDLPDVRAVELRTQDPFVQQCRILHDALVKGGA
jgi:NitT/TauT family transport system ATP-binding protein